MLPSVSTYLQISAWTLDAPAKRTHQHMARMHQAAAGRRFADIAPQCIKSPQPLPGQPVEAARGPQPLEAVIHVELDRMRRHPETSDFFHFQRDVAVEHVVRENTTASEEFAVLVDTLQCFVAGGAAVRDLRGDLWRQVVQILVERIACVTL